MEVSYIDLERMIPDRKSIVSTLQARSLGFYFETMHIPPSPLFSLSLSFSLHLYLISESLSKGILSSPLLYLHHFANIILSQLVSR